MPCKKQNWIIFKIAPLSMPSQIIGVQQSLSALGYNPGKVTGRSNEDTERAIREFETDQNMVQGGRVSGPLVSRLGRLTAAGRPTVTR